MNTTPKRTLASCSSKEICWAFNSFFTGVPVIALRAQVDAKTNNADITYYAFTPQAKAFVITRGPKLGVHMRTVLRLTE